MEGEEEGGKGGGRKGKRSRGVGKGEERRGRWLRKEGGGMEGDSKEGKREGGDGVKITNYFLEERILKHSQVGITHTHVCRYFKNGNHRQKTNSSHF